MLMDACFIALMLYLANCSVRKSAKWFQLEDKNIQYEMHKTLDIGFYNSKVLLLFLLNSLSEKSLQFALVCTCKHIAFSKKIQLRDVCAMAVFITGEA